MAQGAEQAMSTLENLMGFGCSSKGLVSEGCAKHTSQVESDFGMNLKTQYLAVIRILFVCSSK